MNCNSNQFVGFKGIILMPTYSHVMSEKIRQHLIKRFWEQQGFDSVRALSIAKSF